MTRYEVDVPAINGFAADVFAVGADVRATLSRLNGSACVDVGDPGLAGALTAFGQMWGSFTEGSARTVDETGGSIAAASAGYVGTDDGVVADLRVTSAFVGAVAAGSDGPSALQAAVDAPVPGQGLR
jgi:hypothetical protein